LRTSRILRALCDTPTTTLGRRIEAIEGMRKSPKPLTARVFSSSPTVSSANHNPATSGYLAVFVLGIAVFVFFSCRSAKKTESEPLERYEPVDSNTYALTRHYQENTEKLMLERLDSFEKWRTYLHRQFEFDKGSDSAEYYSELAGDWLPK